MQISGGSDQKSFCYIKRSNETIFPGGAEVFRANMHLIYQKFSNSNTWFYITLYVVANAIQIKFKNADKFVVLETA